VSDRDLSIRYKCFNGLVGSDPSVKYSVNWLLQILLCRLLLLSRSVPNISGCFSIWSKALIAAADNSGGSDAEKQ